MLVSKPWGSYTVLVLEDDYAVKQLRISPQQQFSLQKHEHRTEEWTVLEGLGLMTLEEERGHASTFVLTEKSRAIVPKGFIHRLKNISKNKDLLVLEIWWGNKLSEDDIIRYDDEYGREDK